jgi:transmembrane sensor
MNGTPSTNPSNNPEPSSAAERTTLDWARDEGEAEHVLEHLAAHLDRRRRRRTKFAATSAAALVLLGAILWPAWRAGKASSPSLSTATVIVLRPETRALPDGSVVELQAGTEIEVDFAGPLRRVALRKGEAHFQVAKDAQRPFVVNAGGVAVRAVGTAFSVERGAKAIEVLVTEGRVAVEQPAPSAPAPSDPATRTAEPMTTFGAGKRIIVELTPETLPTFPSPQVTTLSASEIDERLAWRVPRLEFSGTPLSQVVRMFNQHGRVRLMLADPSLGRLQLSGVLRADNVESLLLLLEGEFGLVAETHGAGITLRRR